jgi:HEAT repeat protein
LITVYCPACWQEIPEGVSDCPVCGFPLAQDDVLSFEEKLLRSLEHPVQDIRLMAIQILGNLSCQAALPYFERVLHQPEADMFELREVLIALSKFQDPRSAELIQEAVNHPYPMVSRLARRLLQNDR